MATQQLDQRGYRGYFLGVGMSSSVRGIRSSLHQTKGGSLGFESPVGALDAQDRDNLRPDVKILRTRIPRRDDPSMDTS